MASQFKAFLDATGGLWQAGALVGKPAGLFVSVGTQGGGLETTALTAVTQLTHHGAWAGGGRTGARCARCSAAESAAGLLCSRRVWLAAQA